MENLLLTLENETSVILDWFRINEMKSNDDRCNPVVAKNEYLSIKVGNDLIESCNLVDLLGITIDNKLKFNEHVTNMFKKGNQKFHALTRISQYFNQGKSKLLIKTFTQSQFYYFHNRTLNNQINRLHERALRLVYKTDKLSFNELLELDNSVTIHQTEELTKTCYRNGQGEK